MTIENGVLTGITLNEEKEGHIVIPYGVTSIGSSAFNFCTGLTSVVIPDSVTSIKDCAFRHCPNLTNVIIGNGVTRIGSWAFSDCNELKNIKIGDGLRIVGDGVFDYDDNLKSKVANYKAFKITSDGKLKCLDKIYEEGCESSVTGKLKLCKNGIHYCTNLFEIFHYYFGELDKDIAIYECDVSEENIGKQNSSKRCARWIVPRKRLYREDVIRILNEGKKR